MALAAGPMGLLSLLAAKPAHAVKPPEVISQGSPAAPIVAEEPYAGNWKTWVLRSGRDIHLPAPPSPTSAQAMNELAQLRRAQAERTQADIDIARFWDTGPATRRWTEIQLDMIKTHRPSPPRSSRGLALMHIAMFDAIVAAWQAKYRHAYPAPSAMDRTLTSILPPRAAPAYPAEHAIVAGAAAHVLAQLFPRQGADWFDAKAREAAASRLWAGADWPGAVEQGLALGRAVAERVLAFAATDGSAASWDGQRLRGLCYWRPTAARLH